MFYASFTQLLGFDRGTSIRLWVLPHMGTYVNLDQSMDVSKDIYEFNTEFLNTNNRNLHQLVFNDALRDRYPTYFRPRNAKIERKHMDMAALHRPFGKAVFNFVEYAVGLTGNRDICLAGGSALNCTANGKLKKSGLVNRVFVPHFLMIQGVLWAAAVMAAQNGNSIEPLTTAQLAHPIIVT